MMTKFRTVRGVSRLLLLGVFGGCTSSTHPTAPLATVTYNLITIDGKPLPLPEETVASNVIQSGAITLVGSDSARITQTVLAPGPQPLTTIQLGFYSVERTGSTLVFHPHYLASPVDTASLAGTQLLVRAHVVTGAGVIAESRVYQAQ